MVDLVRATVAPGKVIQIAHPSGVHGLPPMTLVAGQTFMATATDARRLYERGDILDLASGKPCLPPREVDGPSLTLADGRCFSLSDINGRSALGDEQRKIYLAEAEKREAEWSARQASVPTFAGPQVSYAG